MSIEDLPLSELIKDRSDCEEDIVVCQQALLEGSTHYGPNKEHSVQERLDANWEMIRQIDADISRRRRELLI